MKHFYLTSIIILLFVITTAAQPFVEQTGISLTGIKYSMSSWGDYDNDGDLDILLSGNVGSDQNPQPISKIYKNNGDGTFTDQTAITLPGIFKEMVSRGAAIWGDYDNDGDLDVLLSGTISTNYQTINIINKIYQNNNNIFSEAVVFPAVSSSNATSWADYDNDGDLDVLFNMKIFKNIGGNIFNEQTTINMVGREISPWADYDNDGDLDIITNYWQKMNLYNNNGDNTFVIQSDSALSRTIYDGMPAWGDYDSDGDLDLLLTGYDGRGYISKIFKNNGNKTFTEQNSIALKGVQSSSVVWGDYDNDGDLDILITGQGISVGIIYRNESNNTFTRQNSISLPNVEWGSVAWGDYDNDGDLDLLITGSGISKVFRNDVATKNIAPSAPINQGSIVNNTETILRWNSVRTDITPYKALTYNVRVGTTPGAFNIVSPMSAANGYRRIPAMGNAQLDTTFILKNLASGTYYWSVQAVDNGFMGGAFSEEGTFTITSTGIKNKENNDLRLYPNPVTNILNIENLPNNSIVNIYSMDGKLYKKVNANNSHIEISTSDLPKGIYILKVMSNQGSTLQKFIKQ